MKEAFIAALLSIGPNVDNEVRLIELVSPVDNDTSEVRNIRSYTPGFTAADNKADVNPHVVRHINSKRS